jgi:hypothetical protein
VYQNIPVDSFLPIRFRTATKLADENWLELRKTILGGGVGQPEDRIGIGVSMYMRRAPGITIDGNMPGLLFKVMQVGGRELVGFRLNTMSFILGNRNLTV